MQMKQSDTKSQASSSEELLQLLTDESTEVAVIGWLVQHLGACEKELNKLSVADFTEDQAVGVIRIMLDEFAKNGMPDERKLVNRCRSEEVFSKYEDFSFYKEVACKDIDSAIMRLKDVNSRRVLADELSREVQNVYDYDKPVDAIAQRLSVLPETILANAKSASKTLVEIELEQENQQEPELLLSRNPLINTFYDGAARKGYIEGLLGRTGHGKTRYAHMRALDMIEGGWKVAWFQMEGDRFETLNDMKAIHGQGDWMGRIKVQDSYYMLSDVIREIRILVYDFGADAIFIDYLQEISAEGFRPSDVRQEKAFISKSLRRLAKELNVYMCWLLQPSRESKHEKGWAKQPSLSDIIETSQIEKDCYVVNGVFRPNMVPDLVYNEKVKWYDHSDNRPNLQPYHSVVVQQLKNRKSPRNRSVMHLIDSERGLAIYTGNDRSREDLNAQAGPEYEDDTPFDLPSLPDYEEKAPF